MQEFVLSYNSIDHNGEILYGYENICGVDAKAALKQRFNRDFERLTGENGRFAEVILTKGHYSAEDNKIRLSGRFTQLCYSRKS